MQNNQPPAPAGTGNSGLVGVPSEPAPPVTAAAATGALGPAPTLKGEIGEIRAKTEQAATQGLSLTRQYLPPTIGVIVLLVAAWFVSSWLRRAVRAGLDRAHFDPTLGRFFSNILRWVVLTLAVITCLNLFGIEQTSFAAVLGAAGLAVGLALQGSLSNMAAGVMLLIFRPFKVGDNIVAAGQAGKVYEIDLFQTKLDTVDGRRVFVPNGPIFASVIENTTYHPRRRIDVILAVLPDAPVGPTREALRRAVARTKGTYQDPASSACVNNFPVAGVEWMVTVWTDTSNYGDVRESLLSAIKEELDQAKIGLKR